ncbi:MAG: hypothetical protein H6579_04380 [Chitinophagales bacterium]|nr:hypothetical protein [Chitinophagales bacterium]
MITRLSYNFDYYPFGMVMPGRSFTSESYRFGFQGQEKNNDISGTDGGHLDFKYRIHDVRLGRFLSVDPLEGEYPWNSPYSFAENKLGLGIELEGRELLDKEEALFQMTYGVLFLKIENFNNISQKMLRETYPTAGLVYYDERTGRVTGEGKIAPIIVKQFNYESDINVPDGKPGEFGKIQKQGQKNDGTRDSRVRKYIGSSTPKGRGALGFIGVAIDAAIFLGNTYQNSMISSDINKLDSQLKDNAKKKYDFWNNVVDQSTSSSPMKLAAITLQVAIEQNLIPVEYQNLESFSKIYNVILYGGDNLEKDDMHYKIGMDLYRGITKKLENYESRKAKEFKRKNG